MEKQISEKDPQRELFELLNNTHRTAKQSIMKFLLSLNDGYGARKWKISQKTGILHDDYLTFLLKQLKIDGYIELIMIWLESTGLPDGSGYSITKKGRELMKTFFPTEND